MSKFKDENLILTLLEKIDEKQDSQFECLTALRIEVSQQKSAFEAHLKQDEDMYKKISEMDDKLGEYNQHLAEHIAGVKELRKLNETLKQEFQHKTKEVEDRLDKVEAPGKLIALSKKVIIKIGEISVAVAAIYGLVKMFFL